MSPPWLPSAFLTAVRRLPLLLLGAGVAHAQPARHAPAVAALQEGETRIRANEVGPARQRYHQAIALARAGGDSLTQAEALYRLGISWWMASQQDSALTYLEPARDLYRRLNEPVALARVENGVGAAYYQLGIYEPAIAAFDAALAVRRHVGDSLALARTLTNIGKTYHDWRQFARARAVLEEAVTIAAAAPDRAAALGYALNSLAMLAIDEGDYAVAQRHIAASRAAYAMVDGLRTRADSSDSWEINALAEGVLHVRTRQYAEAIPLLDSVLASASERQSPRGQARTLLHLGEAHLGLGRVARAREAFRQSLALARGATLRVVALHALEHLANLERTTGNPVLALAHLREYQALRDTIFDQDAALRIASRDAREQRDAALRANEQLTEQSEAQAEVISQQRLTLLLGTIIIALSGGLLMVFVRFSQRERARTRTLTKANRDLELLNVELRTALSEVQTLSGLIPICAHCRRVRDDQGYWAKVETYLEQRGATFSHSICQSCGPELYGQLWYDATGAAPAATVADVHPISASASADS
jgi:tetratricopeptide (TPR) repeat protein